MERESVMISAEARKLFETRVSRMWSGNERGVEYRLHGPAGTGKTWTIVRRLIPRAAEVFGIERIALISMTRAAAAELAYRAGLEPEQVSTFHSMCRRLSTSPKVAVSGKEIEAFNGWLWDEHPSLAPVFALDASDRRSVESIEYGDERAIQRDREAEATPGDKLARQIDLLRHQLVPQSRWSSLQQQWYSVWTEWCEETGYGDFTSWIEAGLEAPYPPKIPGTDLIPEVLILDEAQDSSPLELKVLRGWSSSIGGIVLCGDAQQAIYTFRGADPRAFLTPAIPEERNLVLRQSYRLPRKVLECANAWISQLPEDERYPVDLLPRKDKQGREVEGHLIFDGELTSHRPDRVMHYVDQAERNHQTIAILSSCSRHLQRTTKLLRDQGVQFGCPWRPIEGKWHSTRGWTKILSLLKPLAVNKSPLESAVWTWNDLRLIVEMLDTTSPVYWKGCKALVQRKAQEDSKLANEVVGGRPLGGYPVEPQDVVSSLGGPLSDLLFRASSSFDEGMMIEDLLPHVNSASKDRMIKAQRLIKRYVDNHDPVDVLAWDTKDGATPPLVRIGTTHASKGAEADVVILFPDLTAMYRVGSMMRRTTTRSIVDVPSHERSAEIRRVYVGMTRARDTLILASFDRANRDAIDFSNLAP